MNVISQLPGWAQARARSFAEQGTIAGTRMSPMDEDSFQESFKLAAGALEIAGVDEIPGEDLALGQPGVVTRNGLTLYYLGDSSSSSQGEMEAVITARRRGVEYATYVHTQANSFSTLRMINEDGSVEVRGGKARRQAGQIDGYLISGDLSER